MADHIDYSTVTEVAGENISREQLKRMFSRYFFASQFCRNKNVLEVACGAGQGLGYLAGRAKMVVGGDYEQKLLKIAMNHYAERIPLLRLDAMKLPFRDESFDVVICYEAIYYFPDVEVFLREARRVLSKKGYLILCSANKEWSGFNPSPYTFKYYSCKELYEILTRNNFEAATYADCPVEEKTYKDKLISLIKRIAVRTGLIPKTMKAKEILKRIFCGKLLKMPAELKDGMTELDRPVSVNPADEVKNYKVIFAVARKCN